MTLEKVFQGELLARAIRHDELIEEHKSWSVSIGEPKGDEARSEIVGIGDNGKK